MAREHPLPQPGNYAFAEGEMTYDEQAMVLDWMEPAQAAVAPPDPAAWRIGVWPGDAVDEIVDEMRPASTLVYQFMRDFYDVPWSTLASAMESRWAFAVKGLEELYKVPEDATPAVAMAIRKSLRRRLVAVPPNEAELARYGQLPENVKQQLVTIKTECDRIALRVRALAQWDDQGQ